MPCPARDLLGEATGLAIGRLVFFFEEESLVILTATCVPLPRGFDLSEVVSDFEDAFLEGDALT